MEKKTAKATKKKNATKTESKDAIIEQLRLEGEYKQQALENLKQEAVRCEKDSVVAFICLFSIWVLLLVSSISFWYGYVYGKIEILKWVAMPPSVVACIATIEMVVLCFRFK